MTDQQTKMDPGEKELRKTFEKTTITNVQSIITYNDQTQELVSKLEKHVKDLDGTIRQYDEKVNNIQKQLASLQSKIYRGGSE